MSDITVDIRHPLERRVAQARADLEHATGAYEHAKAENDALKKQYQESGKPTKVPSRSYTGPLHFIQDDLAKTRSEQAQAKKRLRECEEELVVAETLWRHRALPYPQWNEAVQNDIAVIGDSYRFRSYHEHSTDAATQKLTDVVLDLMRAATMLAAVPQKLSDASHYATDREQTIDYDLFDRVDSRARRAHDAVEVALALIKDYHPFTDETPSNRHRLERMASGQSPE
jgi:chromosome segregation ATPase